MAHLREKCAQIMRDAVASRESFIATLSPSEGRGVRLGGVQAVALAMIRDVVEDIDVQDRIIAISAILDASDQVLKEFAHPDWRA